VAPSMTTSTTSPTSTAMAGRTGFKSPAHPTTDGWVWRMPTGTGAFSTGPTAPPAVAPSMTTNTTSPTSTATAGQIGSKSPAHPATDGWVWRTPTGTGAFSTG